MNVFQRFIGHLRTVNRHRAVVCRLCFKCGLYRQGITHDLSKYSLAEFINGVKFYTGVQSPHYGERDAIGYSEAWMHHKGRNKHHAEYWQDIQSNGLTESVKMPDRYLVEMICDRVAAAMTYLGDNYYDAAPLEYYMYHINETKFHPESRKLLEYWLTRIKDNGIEIALNELKVLMRGE